MNPDNLSEKYSSRNTSETDEYNSEYLTALLILENFGILNTDLSPADAALLRFFIKRCFEQFERDKQDKKKYAYSFGSFSGEAVVIWFSHYGIDLKTILKISGKMSIVVSPALKKYIFNEWKKAKEKMENDN